MNVLFITISPVPHMSNHTISLDLLRYFQKMGHNIHVLCSLERKEKGETFLSEEEGCKVLRVKTGNNKKANLIEKGINTLLLPLFQKQAVKQYFADTKFDLILYATPPVTAFETVRFIKKRDGAKAYLMLKDIFPQNAVDIGMMKKSGVKGILYRHFRKKEKKLYAVSDYIGCMSRANVDYVLKHNPEVSPDKVEVCPNTVEPVSFSVSDEERRAVREKYGIPTDKKVFIYGGNLGRPQGIPFLMKALKAASDRADAFFLVVGDGTEYKKLEAFFEAEKLPNARLLKKLPKEDYDLLANTCDVGMIFLDHRFTIPNFPSRLLAYLQASIPVLACTDPNTDIGKVITDGGFGWWCESCDTAAFLAQVDAALAADLPAMGKKGYEFLLENYTSKNDYEIIMKRIG